MADFMKFKSSLIQVLNSGGSAEKSNLIDTLSKEVSSQNFSVETRTIADGVSDLEIASAKFVAINVEPVSGGETNLVFKYIADSNVAMSLSMFTAYDVSTARSVFVSNSTGGNVDITILTIN